MIKNLLNLLLPALAFNEKKSTLQGFYLFDFLYQFVVPGENNAIFFCCQLYEFCILNF